MADPSVDRAGERIACLLLLGSVLGKAWEGPFARRPAGTGEGQGAPLRGTLPLDPRVVAELRVALDRRTLAGLFRTCAFDLERRAGHLFEAARRGDAACVVQECHALRGSAQSYGLTGLPEAAEFAGTHAGKLAAEALLHLVQRLAAELRAARDALLEEAALLALPQDSA